MEKNIKQEQNRTKYKKIALNTLSNTCTPHVTSQTGTCQ